MWQHYQQGRKLKAEYVDKNKLVSKDYKLKEIYVRASDTTRTLISAYSNMAGFYSESSGTHPEAKEWPTKWSPIPVHTMQQKNDYVIWPLPYCPRLTELQEEQLNFEGYRKFISDNKDLFDVIHANGKTNITDFLDLYNFANTIYIERQHNMKLPAWITDDVFNRSVKMSDDGWDFRFGGAAFGREENLEMVKLGGGVLINEMIENMQKKIRGENKYLYHVYSGHDTTVAAFLRTLGAKEAILGHHLADYAATFVLELWQIPKFENMGKHMVRLRYAANAQTPFKTITAKIKGCPRMEFCPLDTFVKNRQKYVIKDVEKACGIKN
ncbi:hypothetical protein L596_007643 [Steinernema carpocapsae]|nr:hypothetical protein L596_007643 [Steinernema carpocapsae]